MPCCTIISPNYSVTAVRHGAEAYAQALSEHAQMRVTRDAIDRWIYDGLCHDALKWLSFHCERRRTEGADFQEWFDSWGLPRVKRLRSMALREDI